jgi:lipooligosaccharide transport system ATP-binding protein
MIISVILIHWSMKEVIVARDLVKVYGDVRAVDGIEFHIKEGECFGFLGPNGAGKSTTIKMINCSSPVTSGNLEVLGMDVGKEPRKIKSLIGVAPQDNNLDPDFAVKKNLTVYARYFDLDAKASSIKADALLEFMQLTEKKDVAVEELSGGMKRRLIIARALMNDPRILILDEPTTGLDPQARHLIWERIRELRRKGVTVILTTHYMDEAEKLCDRLVIMDKGKIVVEGGPADLIRSRIGSEVVEVDEPTDEMEQFARSQGYNYERTVDRLLIYSTCCQDIVGIMKGKFDLGAITVRRATLEDVFLRMTGRRLAE